MTTEELKAYAKAGAVAEEVLSSIRTVFSYNGAEYESKRYAQASSYLTIDHESTFNFSYETHLQSAKMKGIRKGALNGILMGAIWFFLFCTYSLVNPFRTPERDDRAWFL